MELEELVAAAQAGNEPAMAAVCERFTGLVKKYAFQPHVRPIAEEAQAEGWLAMVEAVRSYDTRLKIRFAGYVDSKVRFAVWNLFKRERHHWQNEVAVGQDEDGQDVLASMPDAVDVENMVINQITRAMILSCIDHLPIRQREVLHLTLLGGTSLTDAARQLGVSVQAVFNLRQRALAGVKRSLTADKSTAC